MIILPMKRHLLIAIAILIFLTPGKLAFATSWTGSAVGTWYNLDSQPSDITSIHNYDDWASASFYWGIPAGDIFRNQFIFNGKGDVTNPNWTAEPGKPFSFGYFIYRNMRTMFSSTVNGIDLSLSLNFTTSSESDIGPFLFDFSFDIQNTLNTTGDPILDADIVTFSDNSSPATFNYLLADYTLEVLGLSDDGGKTFLSDLTNPEGSNRTAKFYALISKTSHTPEPSTMLLMIFGLMGIALLKVKPKSRRNCHGKKL